MLKGAPSTDGGGFRPRRTVHVEGSIPGRASRDGPGAPRVFDTVRKVQVHVSSAVLTMLCEVPVQRKGPLIRFTL